MTNRLTIRRPDDWHVHLRDGAVMAGVLPHTARQFARAIVMPNLSPPVTTIAAARDYRARIVAALPAGLEFTPLMTAYLTDATDPDEIARGQAEGVFTAAKLYPANATTGSAHGVTDIANIRRVLERMEAIGLPLLVHGEVTSADVDIFDREAVFIDRVMQPLRRDMPDLVAQHAREFGLVVHQRQQGVHGFLLLRTAGFQLDGGTQPGGQHHDAHDALGVDAALAAAHPDVAGKAACQLGELGRGPGVQAQLIADGRTGLDHG